ncbi:tetratricopeptide repeat protein [Photobacterium phosphoreum]|uniref:tetratricopeptide repeat protein n=1 Tax=Photobacterium phosphoreum TaxID=659 RepID=UPI000ABED68F|nr:tetratricopeptide repeat protein [Photobacterium phosphoreum]
MPAKSSLPVIVAPKETPPVKKVVLPPVVIPVAASSTDIDSEPVDLAAMPVAEAAIETVEMEQELASSYEQGYDSGYQQALIEQQQVKNVAVEQPKKVKSTVDLRPLPSSLSIQTVALTPSQLAEVEYHKAEKVLRQANSRQAIVHLEAALKYRPQWVAARQKLAALYYGRGDNRQAVAMLQQGLQQQPQNTELRLTLAKLLVNEKQPQAALTVLEQPLKVDSVAFLAMRAALAQQLNNTALALTSYQQLLQQDATDGRWWLGLAIAQDRSQQPTLALVSYRNGLIHGGISVASQQFIQQRITALQPQRS